VKKVQTSLEPLFFEDVSVGDVYVSFGRTITEADVVNFAGISGDYNTLHTDAEFARNSIAGQRIAHGTLVLAISLGLCTRAPYNLAMMPNLRAMTQIRAWKFKKPVLFGDTIHVESEVVEKNDPGPERDSGSIVIRRTVRNQRGELVQEGETKLLLRKQNHL
jgi:acyl dehydratase